MSCTIIINAHDRWVAPVWLARNLAAHLDPLFVLAKTDVEKRFSGVLVGRGRVVDLSIASAAEMRDVLKAAEYARQGLKRPAAWADFASAVEFTTAFDEFLDAAQPMQQSRARSKRLRLLQCHRAAHEVSGCLTSCAALWHRLRSSQ